MKTIVLLLCIFQSFFFTLQAQKKLQNKSSGNTQNTLSVQKSLHKNKISNYNEKTKYALGINISSVSATGYSFTYKYAKSQRLKFIEYLYYQSHSDSYCSYSYYFIQSAIEWQYDLHKYSSGRFYYLNSFVYSINSSELSEDLFVLSEYGENFSLMAGAALGIEFYLTEALNFYLHIGLKAGFKQMYSTKNIFKIAPGLGAGLSIAF